MIFLYLQNNNKILNRILERKLYKVIGKLVYRNIHSYEEIKKLVESKFVKDENIIVCSKKLNFTFHNENPMKKVRFIDKEGNLVHVNENIMLMNTNFEEIIVRIIVKNDFPENYKKQISQFLFENGFEEIKFQYK